jgi:hypothetical protein
MPPLKHWIYSGVGICNQLHKCIVQRPDEHNSITIDGLHGPSACWEPGSLVGRENMERSPVHQVGFQTVLRDTILVSCHQPEAP